MDHVSGRQIRQFRLHTHHLDTWYQKGDVTEIAGACGFQNSPPGAWENALHNRVADLKREEMQHLLEVEKNLLQAWSFRGAPVVFPVGESDVFLAALIPAPGEPWIYTRGIQPALDFLQMSFEEARMLLLQVLPKLDGQVLKSKAVLDQTLAEWILPFLPDEKRALWNSPSPYGNPQKQTVGEAVVSFLLRPCSFLGLVVFGKRDGIHPTFTSFRNWMGRPPENGKTTEAAAQKLVRKYLHCYGPASTDGLAGWLGCSPAQAGRLWQTVKEEIEPVRVSGRERYILSVDKNRLLAPPRPDRSVHLLSGHDPYLGLQDRAVILDSGAKQKAIWRTVSNPGAVLWQGEIVGLWKAGKKGRGLKMEITLWTGSQVPEKEIRDAAERYAWFQQLPLKQLEFSP